MHQAFVRIRGEEDWKPVPFAGLPFLASEEELRGACGQLQGFFPNNEYKIVKEEPYV